MSQVERDVLRTHPQPLSPPHPLLVIANALSHSCCDARWDSEDMSQVERDVLSSLTRSQLLAGLML